MKRLIISRWFIWLLLLCIRSQVFAIFIYIDDGSYHYIDDDRYISDLIDLDYHVDNNPGTHLELAGGGAIEGLRAFNNSKIIIRGGLVGMTDTVEGHDNSTINIIDGTVGYYLNIYDNSTFNMTGGHLIDQLWCGGNSNTTIDGGHLYDILASGNSNVVVNGGQSYYLSAREKASVTINGGTFGHFPGAPDYEGFLYTRNESVVHYKGGFFYGEFSLNDSALLYLYGNEFYVNGEVISYGESLRDYATLNQYGYLSGTITGTLSDGTQISNVFSFFSEDSDMIVIPEPTSLLLLSLGGLALRFKKSRIH